MESYEAAWGSEGPNVCVMGYQRECDLGQNAGHLHLFCEEESCIRERDSEGDLDHSVVEYLGGTGTDET